MKHLHALMMSFMILGLVACGGPTLEEQASSADPRLDVETAYKTAIANGGFVEVPALDGPEGVTVNLFLDECDIGEECFDCEYGDGSCYLYCYEDVDSCVSAVKNLFGL